MTSAAAERLFVYGSLQPGGPNAHVLAAVEGDWEPGSVRGRLVDEGWGSRLGFPALRLDPAGERVHGQVLTSRQLGDRWSELDAFEGEEYARAVASVTLERGGDVEAFVYVLRSG